MDIKIKPLAEFDKEYKRLSKKYHSLFGEIHELGEALKSNSKQGKPLVKTLRLLSELSCLSSNLD